MIETTTLPRRPVKRAGLGLLSLTHLTDDIYQGALPAMLPYLVAERHCPSPPRGLSCSPPT